MHGLLHDAVDDVRDAKATLTTTALRNPHAPDQAGAVAAVEQCSSQFRDHDVEVLFHLGDAHAICACCTIVCCDVPKGTSQVCFVCH
jgi:hypothetical protein